MSKITEWAKDMYDCIRHPDNEESLGIAKTKINGIEAEVICWIETTKEEGDDVENMSVQPLALLVNDDIFKMLKNPMNDSKPKESDSDSDS